ncbi:hypothetical protein GCM10009832_23540 [Dietzia kunjamensis subsp. schimae]
MGTLTRFPVVTQVPLDTVVPLLRPQVVRIVSAGHAPRLPQSGVPRETAEPAGAAHVNIIDGDRARVTTMSIFPPAKRLRDRPRRRSRLDVRTRIEGAGVTPTPSTTALEAVLLTS